MCDMQNWDTIKLCVLNQTPHIVKDVYTQTHTLSEYVMWSWNSGDWSVEFKRLLDYPGSSNLIPQGLKSSCISSAGFREMPWSKRRDNTHEILPQFVRFEDDGSHEPEGTSGF